MLDVLQRLVPELRVVECLALAQQTDVQLVPCVPLDALGDELHRVVARQAGDPWPMAITATVGASPSSTALVQPGVVIRSNALPMYIWMEL